MIYITGDTHGLQDFYKLHIFAGEHPELNYDDYVIIAGDFGAVWNSKTLAADLKPYTELPFTVLFVDGNHENFDLIETFSIEEWCGGKIHKIRPNIIHLMRGQVFEINGNTIFTFGGATSIDKHMRREGLSWWPQELPTYEELDEGISNLKKYGYKVDYIITLSCSERALMYPQIRNSATLKLSCPESQMLSYIEENVEYKHWYFGHFHINARLSDKYTVLMENIIKLGE